MRVWTHYLPGSAVLAFVYSFVGCSPSVSGSELGLTSPGTEPVVFFEGAQRRFEVKLENPGHELIKTRLSVRRFQAAATTAIPLGEIPWKEVELLPGQTALHTVVLDFPPVKRSTRFVLQWIDGEKRVAGRTMVTIVPTNFLAGLAELTAGRPIHVVDPHERLTPNLAKAGVAFSALDLESESHGTGGLVIAGPFERGDRPASGLKPFVRGLAEKGANVLWISQPARTAQSAEPPPPSWVQVENVGEGRIVRASETLFERGLDEAGSQWLLLRLARVASRREELWDDSGGTK